MSSLNVIKTHTNSLLIVTAEALTATQRDRMYNPPGTYCLYKGQKHVIVRGCACGEGLPGIAVGSRMLMELQPV